LIDNDKTITQELFRRQFIKDYRENNEVFDEYLDFDGDNEAFYQHVKDIMIKKNKFISTTNTYNSEKELGIQPNEFITQYEIEKRIQEKNDAINKEDPPEIKIQEELEKNKTLEEYKADLNEKDFSNQKPVFIEEIYSWFGEVQVDGSYPINKDICSRKFEISKVILDYLGLNDFRNFRTKISSGEQKEFMERYNYFKDIFSGKAYEQQITKDNDLYKFIMSIKEQTLSFRSYIIKLCDDTYKICGNAFIKKYPKLNYADEFYKDLKNKIKDIRGNIQYESNIRGPTIYLANL